MFKSIIAKSITLVAAAVLVAGVAAFLTSPVAEANAKSLVVLPHAKGDRLPARVRGPACSLRAGPTTIGTVNSISEGPPTKPGWSASSRSVR